MNQVNNETCANLLCEQPFKTPYIYSDGINIMNTCSLECYSFMGIRNGKTEEEFLKSLKTCHPKFVAKWSNFLTDEEKESLKEELFEEKPVKWYQFWKSL